MSLSGNFSVSTDEGVVTYKYVTITAFRGNSELIAIDVLISDKTSGNDGVFRTYEFIPDLAAEINFIEQGYNYLRARLDFSDSETV